MSIHAPANTERIGIGRHLLIFVDGVADDPGLNRGERARLLGLGYKFTPATPAGDDDAASAAVEALLATPEPTPEPDTETTA